MPVPTFDPPPSAVTEATAWEVAYQRFETPERTWSQIVGSPERSALGMLNASAMMATYRFVKGLQSDNDAFKAEVAKWGAMVKALGLSIN